MRNPTVTALLALITACAWGAETVQIIDEHVSVAPWTGEFTFDVPDFSIEHQMRLSLEARIENERLSGSNPWLVIETNGTRLNQDALLNKLNDFKTAGGVDLTWVKGSRFRVLYSPDFEAANVDKDNHYAVVGGEAYRFVLDITPYVQPGENTLALAHQKILEDPSTMVIRNVQVEVGRPIEPPRLDIIERVRGAGGFLMANMQAATRTMAEQQIVRFVETGSFSAVIKTHPGCPLGLGNHHDDNTVAEAARNALGILQQSGLYYGHHYVREPEDWNFFAPMFPFTPVELRDGVIIGEDRIVTATSGRFGWPDGAEAEVFVVGGEGLRVEEPDVTEVTEDGKRLYEIRMSGDQFAIIVRKGLTP